jgi:hypothetical protein
MRCLFSNSTKSVLDARVVVLHCVRGYTLRYMKAGRTFLPPNHSICAIAQVHVVSKRLLNVSYIESGCHMAGMFVQLLWRLLCKRC